MDTLLLNVSWMSFNIFLALIAVGFGAAMLHIRVLSVAYICGFFWLLFLPNTIYLLTDLRYIPEQIQNQPLLIQLLILCQYIILLFCGITTFIAALHSLEQFLLKRHVPQLFISLILIVVNFVSAFGVILGRVQRTNSWDVITNPAKVINDSILTFSSFEFMLFVFLFGVLSNLVYFLLKKQLLLYGKRMF